MLSPPKCPLHKCYMRIARIGNLSFYRCPEYFNSEIKCSKTYSYEDWKKSHNLNKNDNNTVVNQPEKLSNEEYDKIFMIESSKKEVQESLKNRKKEPRWL